MASYLVQMLNHIMGIDPYTYDWRIALYVPGGDPKTDIACEIPNTRRVLVPDANMQPYSTTALCNYTDISFPNLPAGTIAGWFVVNGDVGVVDDVSWVGAFNSYVNVGEGDTLTLGFQKVVLEMNDGSTALPPDGGGGGGPA